MLTKDNKPLHEQFRERARQVQVTEQAKCFQNVGVDFHEHGRGDFIAYYKQLIPPGSKGGKVNCYNYFIKHKPKCKFKDVDSILLKGFAQYLKDKAPDLIDSTKKIIWNHLLPLSMKL
jgi:hypothetical protein